MQHYNAGWWEQLAGNGPACFFAGIVVGIVIGHWLRKGG